MLEYNVVYAASAHYLRHNADTGINRGIQDIPRFNGNLVETAKDFQKILVDKITDTPSAKLFWERKLQINVDDYWNIAKVATQETRLRVLHWKLLHNIYPTNILLCKMNVARSNRCSYCPDEVDFIEHFFFYCPSIKSFWTEVEYSLTRRFDVNLKITIKEVMFGWKTKVTLLNKKINEIILIAKMSISIFKKTRSPFPIYHIFQQQLQIRKSCF